MLTLSRVEGLAMSHDASHYLITPSVAAIAEGIEDVIRLLRSATPERAITFRSAGTSLSGQAQGSGVLVDTRRNFIAINVLDEGLRVRAQPGATLRRVNAQLAPYGRKLGPDPASEIACTIGGVIANNSSGMTCGVAANAYQTIDSMKLVLADGSLIDSSLPNAGQIFRATCPGMFQELANIHDRINSQPELVREIERQFSIKNTMGYGINAFIDFVDPLDILVHLMIGSEGTLGFVAEATFRTIPVLPHAATGLLIFDSIEQAAEKLPTLLRTGPAAIELLDSESLLVAQQDRSFESVMPGLNIKKHAALLVEYQEMTKEKLEIKSLSSQEVIQSLQSTQPPVFSTSTKTRADLWHVRKGLYAAVAGGRAPGTTALLEDVAVPVAELARTCESLNRLFTQHGYSKTVIFGHAKDGNIHFLLNERFDDLKQIRRYTAFTEDMVELVLGNGGTLKAEHGTGRIMAPFLLRQYGPDLYEIMRRIKYLLDPQKILNPDVLISDDPQIYLKHLKVNPQVEEEVDRCVDCGFCEPVCPSKNLTLTPRQRIALRRESARAEASGDKDLVQQISKEAEYSSIDTCATDGMCATTCPVLIDTGSLVKRLRAERTAPIQKTFWRGLSVKWEWTTVLASKGLNFAAAYPRMSATATKYARRIIGEEIVPSWDQSLPKGGMRISADSSSPTLPDAIFFPSCVNTMFGPNGNTPGVRQAFSQLCERAGLSVYTPKGAPGLCCGTPFKSKGMTTAYQSMQDRVIPWLLTASENGRIPIVCDATSCTEGLMNILEEYHLNDQNPAITIIDSVEFAATVIIPKIPTLQRVPSMVLHPTCSSTRLKLDDHLAKVANAVAEEVSIPDNWGCCAFAGDRGMLHPELTASATKDQAAWVKEHSFDAYASCNRTCEIGMSRATGKPYVHVLEIAASLLAKTDLDSIE